MGELKTTFSVEYNKTTTDGNNGLNTLSDATVSWAGIKGGYTDTQMNFWDGDFQFSATAPNRTVGLAGYEFKLGENWTFTLAYETGLPTTQVSGNKFITVYPDDPVGSARLYYDADDVQFQLAGLDSPGPHRRHASAADVSRPADAISRNSAGPRPRGSPRRSNGARA